MTVFPFARGCSSGTLIDSGSGTTGAVLVDEARSDKAGAVGDIAFNL